MAFANLGKDRVRSLPLNQIMVNPAQPRTHFEEEALQQLSQRDRYIFLAHALYQRDFGDLASELGLTYQGAATAYHRARKKIKDTLGRNVK